MTANYEARIAELKETIPDVTAPAANYVSYVVSGNMVYVSGQISKVFLSGKESRDTDNEQQRKSDPAVKLIRCFAEELLPYPSSQHDGRQHR